MCMLKNLGTNFEWNIHRFTKVTVIFNEFTTQNNKNNSNPTRGYLHKQKMSENLAKIRFLFYSAAIFICIHSRIKKKEILE